MKLLPKVARFFYGVGIATFAVSYFAYAELEAMPLIGVILIGLGAFMDWGEDE
jgi:hypothetical protein